MQKKRYIFGKWEDSSNPLTISDVKRVMEEANILRASIQSYPQDKILSVCARLQSIWGNPEYKYRKDLLKELPEVTGFSKEMIVLALEELASVFDPVLLERKLDKELMGLSRTKWEYEPSTQTASLFQPLGTILHILSGNVFLVAIGSLIEGWITGNITILKMSSGETTFLPKFIESLREVDTEGVLTNSLAVIDYSSSQVDVIEEFKKSVDGILVWGGEEAVKAYRNNLPARTRIILYGPRYSFACVTKKGAEESGLENIAEKLALEISIWDQNACTAPQVCFVEGMDLAKALATELSKKMQALLKKIPAGDVDENSATEIQKWRSVAEIAEARGEGLSLSSLNNVDWTVIVKEEMHLEPSPLHRTIKLVPYQSLTEVSSKLSEMRGYLQTVGLCAGSNEKSTLSRYFLSEGALRILTLGGMFGGEIDDPHDGLYDLPQFGNAVYSRHSLPTKNHHLMDCLTEEERKKVLDENFRSLLKNASQSTFYKETLKDNKICSVSEIKKLPILTRELLEENIPPHAEVNQGLATKKAVGGYVSRSGGSTGEPKYSIYDGKDWDTLIAEAVRALRNCGLEPGDRVANCMLSGDLYGSFVSFDHINFRAGAMSFAFAGHVIPEVFLKTWRQFGINVVQGMPTVLIPLFKKLLELEPTFKIEKIIYGGTPLSLKDREWMMQNIGVTRISSVIGANDGGHFAFQCESLTGNFHHVMDDFNYVEIVDEKGNEVEDNDIGKILITSLQKENYPLIRYDIGDRARWISTPCKCLRTNRVLEYLGRNDDIVCVGMMNFRYSDVLSALKNLSFSVLQLAARTEEKGEVVIIRVETDEDPYLFRNEVEKAVFTHVPLLEKRLVENYLADVRFEIIKTGSLERNARTGKVRLIVDERF